MRSIRMVALVAVASAALLTEANGVPPATTDLAEAITAVLESRGEVYQPQLAVEADGTVLLVWREGGGRASDLFIADRQTDGEFAAPRRVNHEAGGVGGMDLDETRASIALGPDGRIAVAWSARGSIHAAVGIDHGTRFEPAVRLDGAPEGSYIGFVSVVFDRRGTLHAAWIDGRGAPRGMEEPADLYTARLSGGVAHEQNLTADQEASICGCCRTHVSVDHADRVRITFRNTTDDGYRDIWRVDGDADGHFGAPRRVGPAMWELRGCPVQGPITIGETTLWNEASTGHRRLLAGTAGEDEFAVVLEDSDAWRIMSPPREVAGSDGALLLVPGRPGGVLLGRHGDEWAVVAEELPVWATSAARQGDAVVLVGALNGSPSVETHQLTAAH